MLTAQVEEAARQVNQAPNPVEKPKRIQQRIDQAQKLEQARSAVPFATLEAQLGEHAGSCSSRKKISWQAWWQVGVPAPVPRAAGITRTQGSRPGTPS